jgi:hypothetical protein
MEAMMDNKSGCIVCGRELRYLDGPEELRCELCGATFLANAKCVDGHFVCDACHGLPANDLIEAYTIRNTSKDPLGMAITLMRSPALKMHGPEHHFLVPAVLLSAFSNASGHTGEKETWIRKARQRAEQVPGDLCGFFGDCAAAVGAGIFMSIVTNATPLSRKEWQLSNLITAHTLRSIALAGGPRCCKRNSFLAIQEAVLFIRDRLHVAMGMASFPLHCEFHHLNRECRKAECRFYPV